MSHGTALGISNYSIWNLLPRFLISLTSDMSVSFKCCWSHLCDFDIKTVNVALVPVFFKLLFSFFFKDLWKFIIAAVWRLFVFRNNLYLKIDLSSTEVGAWCSVLQVMANKSRFKHLKNCFLTECKRKKQFYFIYINLFFNAS